jgi:hypothetical protein
MRRSKVLFELLSAVVIFFGAWTLQAQPAGLECELSEWEDAYCAADAECEQTPPQNPLGCMEAEVTNCYVIAEVIYYNYDCWELDPEFCTIPQHEFCE